MAQKFISPGVFTTEIDLSFLAQGVAGIGAVVVCRTLKGPAMVPTVVNGFDAFQSIFGGLDTDYQGPYAARNYLRNSANMTVVRVLGHDDGTSTTNGYSVANIFGIADAAVSGNILAVLHTSGNIALKGVALDANNFTFAITGDITFGVTASFLTSSANYIEKVLNTDPTKMSTYGHYLYRNNSYASPAASASWTPLLISGGLNSFARNFEPGITEWVKSQPIGGTEFNLFRFYTLAHGKATNDDIKVMISNVKQSPSPTATPYGTFDVIVRQFSDTDQRMVALETFTGVTLDPSSKNYISRIIGDQSETFDTSQRKFIASGDFENKSKFIRVELSTANRPDIALPFGHRGYTKEVFVSGSTVPSLRYTANLRDRGGTVDTSICWGITYVSGGVDDRMKAFPNNASALTSSDTEFSLANLSASYVNGKQFWNYAAGLAAASQYSPVYQSASLHKFTLPFLGGFDGFDARVKDPLYLSNAADDTDIGVVSAKRALDTIANPDIFDMNLLTVPGIHNINVTDKARTIVNDRGDALFIMDVTGSSVNEAINGVKAREIDDNYTATYYPDLKINDKINNRKVRVAPSVAVLGAMAFSDRVGQVWLAPAGFTRGGLGQFDVVDVVDRLSFQDRNDLYDARINPIATFPNEGIVVFGQKTLQIKASALDRVNVRRLVIFAKKTIASAAKMLLFEPNNPQTWQRFVNTVNPILENVRQGQGINRFKVVMDSSTNTSDLIDRNVMTGKIFLEPTKTGEFIDLSFVITNSGVSFDE